MPRAPDPDPPEGGDRRQDPRVERLRPDPSQPPTPSRTLEGLLGDSDRPGFRRLYLTAELDVYAEFRVEDVLSMADVPPDQPPFFGEQATRVDLRRDAPVDLTRSQRPTARDDFDLDVRLGAGPSPLPDDIFETRLAECGGGGTGVEGTCLTCVSCGGTCEITICRGATCLEVCDTRLPRLCGELTQATCPTCRTCETCRTCGQATCQTCRTQCGTCATCRTCGQATCQTCRTQCGTCATCLPACGHITLRTCVVVCRTEITCGVRCALR